MKKTAIAIAGMAILLIGLAGCSQQKDIISNSDFEEKHADDMAQREEIGSQAKDDIATPSMLIPENEVDIVNETVEYFSGTEGYLAYPQDNPDAPAVVVIHEWRGLNEHIKEMTQILAMNGYTALAVDLYDGEVADDSSRARELSSSIDQDGATQNLLAAEDYLRTQRGSDKVASLGWCLGGKQSLQLSLASNTLDATVIYYGRLETDPDVVEAINTPILGIFAENDQGIPPSQVEMFEEALAQVGISDQADITIYPGVDHAFANPSGNNYSAEATQQAREKTISFLQNNL